MNLEQFKDSPFQVYISFHKIIKHWEQLAASQNGMRAQLAKQVLKEIEPFPELRNGITEIEQIKNNSVIISHLLSELFPDALTHNEIKAVTVPYQDLLINPTQRFQQILNAAGHSFDMRIRDLSDHQFYVMSCCIIMNEVYGTSFDFSNPLFYDIPTADGVIKHYRILYNADFIELIPNKNAPVLTPEDITLLRDNFDDFDLWRQKFPPGSWLLKGFTIVTLFDATIENAVSVLKETLLYAPHGENLNERLTSVFRSIYRIPDLHIGFTSFDPDENKFSVASFNKQIPSYILPDQAEQDSYMALCVSAFNSLIKKKTYFAVADVPKFLLRDKSSPLAQHFNAQNIKSFILAPVIKNDSLLGIFEVISYRAGELNSINANRLDIVMPFLTDTIDRQFTELQNRMQALIQNEYTTVHSSVYWKFKREALKYIQYSNLKKEYVLKEITFKEVYPLYGQIDIKGSSDARNKSLQQDMQDQLISLIALLEELSNNNDIAGRYLQELRSFEAELNTALKADSEQFFNHYLETQIHPLLNGFAASHALIAPAINDYFIQCNKDTGDFHLYRRKYDTTVTLINQKMALLLDGWQVEAQAWFPHYYERFKTDGVEHNLYIGASIVPNRKFELVSLYNLRLWQLQVLCELELEHNFQKSELPYPMDVTSLILVFSSPISIRFRMDEKRFDVDGTYNARFEMVKKRIDKAFIKNTRERIAAVGKITVVYSNKEEELEYITYIQFLQSKQILDEGIEMLEVEDLQGISGLKALRVNIMYNYSLPVTKRYDYSELLDEMKRQNV
jgi:hypothetical protein